MKRRLPLLLGLALVPAHLACGKRPQTATPSPPTPTASATAPAAKPSGPRQKTLLRGAAVMTATGKIYERADVLLEGDQIVAVGPDLAAPADAKVVDLAGKTLTPGIIDTHSHLGVYAAPGLVGHSEDRKSVV